MVSQRHQVHGPMVSQSGQGLVEYLLLLAIIATAFTLVLKGFDQMKVTDMLMKPITQEFAAVYQYGHPKAKGFENGSPEYHPLARGGSTNFRVFFNPGRKK